MRNLKSMRDELATLRQAIETMGGGSASVVAEHEIDPRRLARCVALMISRLAAEERGQLGGRMTPPERRRAREIRDIVCRDEAGRRLVAELERTAA